MHAYDGRQDKDKMLEASRRLKGCYGPTANTVFKKEYNGMIIEYNTCPGNIKTLSTEFVFELFAQHDKGINILNEAYEDWVIKVTQAFSVIEDLRREYSDQKQKQEDRLNGRRSINPNSNRRR